MSKFAYPFDNKVIEKRILSKWSKQHLLSTFSKTCFLLILGDDIILGNCRRGVDPASGETVWDSNDKPGTTLLSSCTILGPNGTDFMRAQDCINGTLLPSDILGQTSINLTTLQNVFEQWGAEYKLDVTASKFPYEDDILIFNQSRLMINLGNFCLLSCFFHDLLK